MINHNAIRGLAITTAFHRRDWCPGTPISEAIDDFAGIQALAIEYVEWAGYSDISVEYTDIVNAIWGIDPELAQSVLDEEMAE